MLVPSVENHLNTTGNMSHRWQYPLPRGNTFSKSPPVQLCGQSQASGKANRSMCVLSILLVSMIDQSRCLHAERHLPFVSLNKSITTLTHTISKQVLYWNPSNASTLPKHKLSQLFELPRQAFNANAKPEADIPKGQTRRQHKRDADEIDSNPSIEAREVKQCFIDVECFQDENFNETVVKCVDGKCQLLVSLNSTQGGNMKNRSKPIDNSLRMLPIMIILGIMFVGMCVAMNMFSRARFKNQRSIFSNPRILKLANANQQSGKQKKSRTHRQLFLHAREQALSHHARHNKVQASEESIEDRDNESNGSNMNSEDIPTETGLSAVVVTSTIIASDITQTH